MASPQLENGYTSIANEILEALWKVNLSPYEYRVLLYLLRKTYGWQKKTDRITLSQFAKDIGIDRRLIFRAIKKLSSKQMIVIYKDDKNRLSYGFQKDYDKWAMSSKEMTVISTDDKVSSKEMTKLSSKQIPTKENIINYINKDINIIDSQFAKTQIEESKPSPSLKSKRKIKLADEEFIDELKKLYPEINIDNEIRKMKAWLLTPKGKGRQLTRRFVVNWLNKIDVPIKSKDSW